MDKIICGVAAPEEPITYDSILENLKVYGPDFRSQGPNLRSETPDFEVFEARQD